MFDLILLDGNGVGAADLSLLSLGFSGGRDKPQIPQFESEVLKAEKKSAENKTDNRWFRFGRAEIFMVLGFIAFELAVFWLCSE